MSRLKRSLGSYVRSWKRLAAIPSATMALEDRVLWARGRMRLAHGQMAALIGWTTTELKRFQDGKGGISMPAEVREKFLQLATLRGLWIPGCEHEQFKHSFYSSETIANPSPELRQLIYFFARLVSKDLRAFADEFEIGLSELKRFLDPKSKTPLRRVVTYPLLRGKAARLGIVLPPLRSSGRPEEILNPSEDLRALVCHLRKELILERKELARRIRWRTQSVAALEKRQRRHRIPADVCDGLASLAAACKIDLPPIRH